MKILKLLWICCLFGCILMISESAFCGERAQALTNIQVNDLQTQKKNTILEKLEKGNLILTEIKKLDKNQKEDVECLALNIYHEARGSSINDRIASSLVVFNRFNDKSYPLTNKKSTKNLCDVIFDRWQFCWTNNDVVPLPKEKQPWKDAQELAYKLYTNDDIKTIAKEFKLEHYVVTPLVYSSKHPKWIDKRKLTVQIGKHSYMSLVNTNMTENDVNKLIQKALVKIYGNNIKHSIHLSKIK